MEKKRLAANCQIKAQEAMGEDGKTGKSSSAFGK